MPRLAMPFSENADWQIMENRLCSVRESGAWRGRLQIAS
jgi:hypothetical protein